jgi:hypothetical protein
MKTKYVKYSTNKKYVIKQYNEKVRKNNHNINETNKRHAPNICRYKSKYRHVNVVQGIEPIAFFSWL